jgi:hypothetical protein
MSEPSQQQPNRQIKSRTQPAPPPTRPAPPPPASMPTTAPAGKSSKGQSAFTLEQDQRVAGQAGEQNLNFEWIEVWVGRARSGRFNVTTAADHGLEVTIEQAVYSRSYQGTGRVETSVVPIAPIGTKGKVTARDTTTGEVLLRPYKWINIDGGGGGGGLWELIKRLFGGS